MGLRQMARVPASKVIDMPGNKKIARILIGLLFAFQTALAVEAESTACHPHQEHSQGRVPDISPEVNSLLFE